LDPKDPEQRKTVDPRKLEKVGAFEVPVPEPQSKFVFADFVDYRYGLNLIVALMGLYWLVGSFRAHGWEGISINTVNFTFLSIWILLHPSPASVTKAALESAAYIYGIVLQFPFYSGMYGIIKGSGLSEVIGKAFVAVASTKTLPLIVYWYSGIVNYFVP